MPVNDPGVEVAVNVVAVPPVVAAVYVTVALVPALPSGFLSPPIYDSMPLYHSGINFEAGCGFSNPSTPLVFVKIISILPLN